ncbi:MAG: hypothetical protein ACKOC8_10505 [Pirellulales bacterium]
MTESAWFRAVDAFVERIHRAGFVQSLIVHVAAILIMALVVVMPDDPESRPPVVLDFEAEPVAMTPADDLALAEVEMPPAPWEEADADIPPAEIEAEPVAAVVDVSVEAVDVMTLDAPEPLALPDADDLLAEIPVEPVGRPMRQRVGDGVVPAGFADARVDGAGGGGGGAIGGEIGRRLRAAGAMTGDVQVSIAWSDVNDIDVHVMVEPFGGGQPSLVCWTSRVGSCGGMLDVDANVHPAALNNRPVENIFWRKGAAPYGRYTVAVHHYHAWSGVGQSQVEVAVLVDGEVQRFYPVVTYGQPLQVVTRFERRRPAGPPAVRSAAAMKRAP